MSQKIAVTFTDKEYARLKQACPDGEKPSAFMRRQTLSAIRRHPPGRAVADAIKQLQADVSELQARAVPVRAKASEMIEATIGDRR